MRVSFLFILSALICGCGSWNHYKPDSMHQAVLNSWEGTAVDGLYFKLGQPTQREKLSSGRETLTYRVELKPPSTKDKGMPDKYYCEVKFLVGANNMIRNATLVERLEPPWGNFMPCSRIIVESSRQR